MGLALTRTPVEVQVYVIDLGAGRSGPCSTCRTWPASPPVASPTSSPGSWPRCRRCWTIAARALAHGANDACRAIAEAWTGPQGPKLRLLPTRIDLATLQEQVPPGGAPVIGINEARLEPVRLDMSHDPHFIVLGDAKTGRRRQSRHVRTDHPDAERLVDTRHHAALKSRRGAAARAAETHPRASGTSAPHQPRPRGPVAPARLGAPTQ